jgi:biotin-(acetyl-CoA carboxylase) ligase
MALRFCLQGAQSKRGIVRGVDHDGALLFEENGIICRITGGEVSLRPSNFGKT